MKTFDGEVLGLLQTEHSGIGFNPFVNESHVQCKSLLLLHWTTRASSGACTQLRPSQVNTDSSGSVRAVTNQWGSPLYMFDYDVFGTPLQDRPERFRHGFTGKEYDSWTGLYNYGFRDYASLYGRFTTVDPIQDGHNWYAYVNSDPVNWLDPWGLEPCEQKSGEDTKKEETEPKQSLIDREKNQIDKLAMRIFHPTFTNETNHTYMVIVEKNFDEDNLSQYIIGPGESFSGKFDGIYDLSWKDFKETFVKVNDYQTLIASVSENGGIVYNQENFLIAQGGYIRAAIKKRAEPGVYYKDTEDANRVFDWKNRDSFKAIKNYYEHEYHRPLL